MVSIFVAETSGGTIFNNPGQRLLAYKPDTQEAFLYYAGELIPEGTYEGIRVSVQKVPSPISYNIPTTAQILNIDGCEFIRIASIQNVQIIGAAKAASEAPSK